MMAERFSVAEVTVSFFLYVYFIVTCFYNVYKASLEKEDMLSFDLHPSWWFGRKMDDTDYEWRFWADFFSQNMHWLLIHLIMGLAINHQLSKGRIYANIVFSLGALCVIFGLKQLTFLICNVCVVYMSVVVCRRKSAVWIVSLLVLGLLNMQGSTRFLMELCRPDPQGTRYMALVYAMSISNLRLVSLGVDIIDNYELTGRLEPFYKVICYALYFPTFLSGPFIGYQTFITHISSQQQPLSRDKLKSFLANSSLLIFWWLLMEIFLHYFYCSALQQEEYFLLSADNLTVFALCLAQAFLFNLKYWFVFGVPSLFAEADGLPMPDQPVGLLTQYKASTIWRKFDIGLYNFITRYLYVPLGGNRFGISQQVVTVFICFIFIGFWHGASPTMFVWALVNFIMIVMENLLSELRRSRHWVGVELTFGKEAAFRLYCLALAPVGLVSLWSMFVFLGGSNVGYNLYKKMYKNASAEARLTLVGLAYWHIVFAYSLERKQVWDSIKKTPALVLTAVKLPFTECYENVQYWSQSSS